MMCLHRANTGARWKQTTVSVLSAAHSPVHQEASAGLGHSHNPTPWFPELPCKAGAARCTRGCLHSSYKSPQGMRAGSCLASLQLPSPLHHRYQPVPGQLTRSPPPLPSLACRLFPDQMWMAVFLGPWPCPKTGLLGQQAPGCSGRCRIALKQALTWEPQIKPMRLTWKPQKGPNAAVTHAT